MTGTAPTYPPAGVATPTPAQPPTQDTATRRACDQWIRDALKENKTDVEAIRADMDAMRADMQKFIDCAMGALPNKDPRAHLTAHERLDVERQEKERRAQEDAKLRQDVRNGVIKTVVNVVLVAAAGVVMLGVQTQFGIWVNNVKAEAPKGTTK